MPQRRARLARAAAAVLLSMLAAAAGAESLRYCDASPALTAAQQSRLLRVASLVRDVLAGSGTAAALVSRSGLALARFGQRYSHAGVALAASAGTPWSVRQLYFACDEHVPRLFDQGLAAFVMGTENPSLGYLSIVVLPAAEAESLARRALDSADSLRLLGSAYSANAFAFSPQYQNCNQWVAELLASAWGSADSRSSAQAWLQAQGFEPTVFEVGALMVLAPFIPWVRSDDHPPADRDAARFRVTMPESIEAFVRRRLPGAERVELCHDGRQLVLRRGWKPIEPGCRAEGDDRIVALD